MKRKIKANPLIMFLFKDIDLLEHDARSQYKFNRFFAILWFVVMIGLPFDKGLYAHSISALIITEVSLWANFATHFSGMSSALAASNTSRTVDNIAEDVGQVGEVLGV